MFRFACLFWRFYVGRSVSAHAPAGDFLHCAAGVWSQEVAGVGQGLGEGIRALKDGMKDHDAKAEIKASEAKPENKA